MHMARLVLPVAMLIFCNLCAGNKATTDELLDAKDILSDKTAPTIISPASGGGGRALNQQVTLLWATKIPARYYEVEISSDSAFQSPISGSPFRVTAPTTELVVTLPNPVRYYWRLRTNYNAAGTYSTSYFDAMDSSVYVYCSGSSATCDDTGQAGNKSHPFRTISGALAYARTSTVGDILVARRESNAVYNDTLIVIPGVNLKGGYTSSFDPALRNVSYGNQTIVSYNGTVLFALNVTKTTLIQGFNLVASGTTSNIALITGSSNSLTLQENRLETTVSQPGPSYALLIQNSGTSYATGPLITGNVFLSGNVTTASSVTAAVRLENSSLTMRANYIKSGTIVQGITNFPSLAAGLLVVSADPLVTNNVIIASTITTAGADSWSIGAYLYPANGGNFSNNTLATLSPNGNAYAMAINGGTSKPIITNNIFFNSGGGRNFYEWNAGDNPVSLHNNAFINFATSAVLYRDSSTGDIFATTTGTGTPAALNAVANTNQGAAATVSGNISLPTNTCIPFVNYAADNWQLQQNTCSANEWRDIRYGGRNTSLNNCGTGATSCGAVTNDINLVTRTAVNTGASPVANAAGYAIGAYEQD
jgi:hypothetical protein